MKLACVIVDDEYLAIKILEEYLSRISSFEIAMTFRQPQEALDYLLQHTVDLLFLDIQMPYLNGFELLTKLEQRPMVVFTTARHDYAVQAYDLDVLDYLVKPIPFDRFEKSIAKAVDYLNYKRSKGEEMQRSANFLMIKADYRIHKILFDDILYIEGLSEYVKIHTERTTYIPLASLRELSRQLPEVKFIRIHKSYIIATGFVKGYSHQDVTLKNDVVLPIGRSYKNEAVALLKGDSQ